MRGICAAAQFDMADAAPGSIADTVSRIVLWSRYADHGFIRAIFDDGRARDVAIDQLEERLVKHGVSFHRLDMPVAANSDNLSLRLSDELARLGPGVVSLTGFELSLPVSGPALESALLALNSRRENFSFPGQHTIWWFPRHIAQALIREHRDLNSWFLRRVELTEVLSTPVELKHASMNHEAIRLSNAAAYAEAEPLLRELLASGEAQYGSDSLQLTPYLVNLATLLRQTNRFSESETLFRRALRLQEEHSGPSHGDIAFTLSGLASVLQDTSRFAEGEQLFRRALAIDEASHGPNHPFVATDLNNLAVILMIMGRESEAEPLLRRALKIKEFAAGPNHPDVAAAATNLGGLLSNGEEYAEAEQLYRRALSILEESLGKRHPDVASNLSALALLLQARSQYDEAEQLMRRALEIDETSLGKSHPDVAVRLHNLSLILAETSRTWEAKALLQRSLSILAASSVAAGHFVTGLKSTAQSYRRLLLATGLSKSTAEEQMVELFKAQGFSRQKAKQLARN